MSENWWRRSLTPGDGHRILQRYLVFLLSAVAFIAVVVESRVHACVNLEITLLAKVGKVKIFTVI